MNEVEITSWNHFSALADSYDVGGTSGYAYAFRGQSISDWQLVPTLTRLLIEKGIDEEKGLAIEQQILKDFKSQAHLFLSPNEFAMTTDTISWWTVMQHHGAPTRLLDWCTSIFVATYFAVVSNLNKPGSVWILHIHTHDDKMKHEFGDKIVIKNEGHIESNFLKPGAKMATQMIGRQIKSQRMVAQQGFFGVSRNVLCNHGSLFERLIPAVTGPAFFAKINIPPSLKPVFIRKLRNMNISGSTLFPGIDGVGKSMDEFVRMI